MCLLFHKRQWFKFTIWCCCHIWGTWTERIRHEGMWKSNLESNYSSESKRSREFLKAMSLEKWVVAQIQHNGLNHFDKSSSASWKCITPAIGSLEHFYEEPSPLLYFSGQKRRKRALDLIANPQEWLFSHFYKHLVSMEGGYLAANIGNHGHSTPTISSTIARRKKKIHKAALIRDPLRGLLQKWVSENTLNCGNVQEPDGGKQASYFILKAFTLQPKVGTSINPRTFCQEQGHSFLFNSQQNPTHNIFCIKQRISSFTGVWSQVLV